MPVTGEPRTKAGRPAPNVQRQPPSQACSHPAQPGPLAVPSLSFRSSIWQSSCKRGISPRCSSEGTTKALCLLSFFWVFPLEFLCFQHPQKFPFKKSLKIWYHHKRKLITCYQQRNVTSADTSDHFSLLNPHPLQVVTVFAWLYTEEGICTHWTPSPQHISRLVQSLLSITPNGHTMLYQIHSLTCSWWYTSGSIQIWAIS